MATTGDRAWEGGGTREARGQSGSARVSDKQHQEESQCHLKVTDLSPGCGDTEFLPSRRAPHPAAQLPEQRDEDTQGPATSGQRWPGSHREEIRKPEQHRGMSSKRLRKPHHQGTLRRDVLVNIKQQGRSIASFHSVNIPTVANDQLSRRYQSAHQHLTVGSCEPSCWRLPTEPEVTLGQPLSPR